VGAATVGMPEVDTLRQRSLRESMPAEDRGALLALLGSAERSLALADRVLAERRSVPREAHATVVSVSGAAAAVASQGLAAKGA
jgi:phosphate:Na+ symporter